MLNLSKLSDNEFKQHSKMNFSGILIDFGSDIKNKNHIEKGMEYCNLYIEKYGIENTPIQILYNLLNGVLGIKKYLLFK